MPCGGWAQDNYAIRMLKKSLFSPARPRRTETRLFPCSVLGSSKSSTYPTRETSCPGSSGTGRVRKGTLPVSTRLQPCWTAFLSILRDTIVFRYLLNARERTGVSKTSLPTVAPVARSIVAWAVDVWAVKKWRPVDPGASQVEPESHRGIGVEGRDRVHDSGWLCQLTLQVGTRRGLAVELIL